MSLTQIPALCPSCGAIFVSRLISIGDNVKNLTLMNNKETCPFCGNLADTAEGVFDIADNIISVISAPHITKQMLSALSIAVKKAYTEKTQPEELIKTVEKIDPSLGETIRKYSKTPFYLTAMLLIYLAIKSCTVDVEQKLDVNQLIDQFKSASPAQIISPQPDINK